MHFFDWKNMFGHGRAKWMFRQHNNCINFAWCEGAVGIQCGAVEVLGKRYKHSAIVLIALWCLNEKKRTDKISDRVKSQLANEDVVCSAAPSCKKLMQAMMNDDNYHKPHKSNTQRLEA